MFHRVDVWGKVSFLAMWMVSRRSTDVSEVLQVEHDCIAQFNQRMKRAASMDVCNLIIIIWIDLYIYIYIYIYLDMIST